MTAPSASDQLIPNEDALEKLFRAHYAELLSEAKTKLPGAETAAPRVVSKAFHLAWNDRAQIKSQEELMAFLRSSVQHGAAREISRRAGLHRADHAISGSTHESETPATLHHHDPVEMGIDEAWDRLKHTLAGGAPEAYKRRASAARHEAAEHMKELGKERSWTGLAVAGLLGALALVALFWWIDRKGEGRRIERALAAQDARFYESPGSRLINVTLDDGTVVNLGPESKLTVPRMFGPNLRAVKVEGSANFNVVQQLDHPFRVQVGNAWVLVRSTVFTVRRYKDDSAAVIRVKDGTVEVVSGQEIRAVNAGQALRVADGGAISEPSQSEVEETYSWAEGRVIISGRTLRYVIPRLKRYYGLDIKVPDARLLDRPVFLSAPLNSPREAITSVETSAGVRFGYVGENMTFSDTAGAPATKGVRRR